MMPPLQCPNCEMNPNLPPNDLMRRLPTTNAEQEEDNVIGSAILSEQKGDDKDFPIPRKDYINALLTGDAAIMKQLNVQGELKYYGAINSSCSDTECSHTNLSAIEAPLKLRPSLYSL